MSLNLDTSPNVLHSEPTISPIVKHLNVIGIRSARLNEVGRVPTSILSSRSPNGTVTIQSATISKLHGRTYMQLATITVTHSTDREYLLTRTEDVNRVSETRWCYSWSGLYHQLREWHVDDKGIQSVEHQLTKKINAIVQVGLR
jgi:hypothetical protein